MYPLRQQVYRELEEGGRLNPGKWVDHCINSGRAAQLIAENCPGMDPEKAFALGALHDIGRREGRYYMRHIIDGYKYALSRGWDEVARVCLTHSFPIPDITTDIQKADISGEDYSFLRDYLENAVYDDYDKLVIMCDCLGDAGGFCILEKRMVDTARRYGVFEHTIKRWNVYFEYKEYFSKKMGKSVYSVLPGIEKSLYD